MPPPLLDVHGVVVGMFTQSWQQRRAIWDMMTVPLIISIAIQLAAQLLLDMRGFSLGTLAARLLDAIPTTMFLVAWLRRLLLGEAAAHWLPGLVWSARETRFLLHLMSLALVPAVLLVLPLLGNPGELSAQARAVGVGALVMVVFALRLAFGLSATAVDLRWDPAQSWRYGRGRGLAIIAIMLVPILLGAALSLAALLASTALLEPFVDESAGQSPARLLVILLVSGIVAYAQTAVIGVALAEIFRAVTGFRPGTALQPPP